MSRCFLVNVENDMGSRLFLQSARPPSSTVQHSRSPSGWRPYTTVLEYEQVRQDLHIADVHVDLTFQNLKLCFVQPAFLEVFHTRRITRNASFS